MENAGSSQALLQQNVAICDPLTDGGVGPDIAALHPQLIRYARRQLRNAALADDAVSEAIMAALEKPRTFATPSQAKAWMYGILRHKLVDQLRQQHREAPQGDLVAETEVAETQWADASNWTSRRVSFDQPVDALRMRQLVEDVRQCCQKLPVSQGHAFVLRELADLDANAICLQMGISEGHLWVLLHRARMRLRQLMAPRWKND